MGDSLTPQLLIGFAQAFGTYLKGGTVVIGRDTRPSGEMVQRALIGGLLATGCDIVDLLHLPTDARVLEVIQANRKLELMTLGEFRDALDEEGSEDEVIVEELVA